MTAAPVRIAGHGLTAVLPHPWEARLYLRPTGLRGTAPHAYGHPEEIRSPVLHVANFPLPPGRGDFGTGAVEIMGAHHVFASLLEYAPEEAGRPLFEYRGVPRPQPGDFSPNALQRRLRGQAGWQGFFSEQGRAFCLYVVLGASRRAADLVRQLYPVLDALEVGPR